MGEGLLTPRPGLFTPWNDAAYSLYRMFYLRCRNVILYKKNVCSNETIP